MKNLSITIVIVAVVSLLYLFAPCNASAQIKPPDTCCWNSPSADTVIPGSLMPAANLRFASDSMSPTYPTNPNTSSSGNILESKWVAQFSSAAEMPVVDRTDRYTILLNDKETFFGELS